MFGWEKFTEEEGSSQLFTSQQVKIMRRDFSGKSIRINKALKRESTGHFENG